MAKNTLPTEEELLANGTLVSGPNMGAPASAFAGLPTEAELMARGRPVTAAAGPTASQGSGMSLGDRALREAGLAIRAPLQAAGSYLDIVGAPLAVTLNRAFPGEGGQPRFQTPSQNIAQLADVIGLPKPASTSERISGAMQQRAYETLGPAGLAQQLSRQGQRLVGSQPVQNLLQQIGRNPVATTAASTAGAGAGQVAREFGVSEPVATAIDIATGVAFTPITQRINNAAMNRLTQEGQRAEALAAAAKREGVQLSTGDLGSRTAQRLENWTVDIPFSGREAIQAKTGEQIKAALQRLDNDVTLLGPDGKNPTTPGKVIIDALRNQYTTAKGIASSKYNSVAPLLQQVPGTERVPMTNFAPEARAFLKEFPDYLKSPDVPQSTKDMLSLMATGNVKNIALDYEAARSMSKAIGQAMAQANRQAKTTGNETMAGMLSNLYKNISKDFSQWATEIAPTNPAAARAFADANAYFKEAVLPFRSQSNIYKLVSRGTTDDELNVLSDKVMKNLLKEDQPELAGLATRLGGPQAQRAAEAEIVQRATRAGLDENTIAEVSPARFVNTINMQSPLTQRVLGANPELMSRVQGLRDVAQAGRGSIAAMSPAPRTGAQLKPFATAAALFNPVTTVPTAVGLGAARLGNRLSLTPAGQSLMFAEPTQPGQYLLPAFTGLLGGSGQ